MDTTGLQIREFYIDGGQTRPTGPYTGIAHAKDLGRASLFVLAEPLAASTPALGEQVIDSITRCFQRQSLSLTGAVSRCLQAAHDELAEGNRRSFKEQQAGFGVSCLVIRSSEVYLSQVGPALAYIRTGATFKRLALEDAEQALGLAVTLRPLFSRHLLTAGDSILMAFSALRSRGNEQIAAALALSPDEALHRIQSLARDLPHCAALLIALPIASYVGRGM